MSAFSWPIWSAQYKASTNPPARPYRSANASQFPACSSAPRIRSQPGFRSRLRRPLVSDAASLIQPGVETNLPPWWLHPQTNLLYPRRWPTPQRQRPIQTCGGTVGPSVKLKKTGQWCGAKWSTTPSIFPCLQRGVGLQRGGPKKTARNKKARTRRASLGVS